MELIKKKLLLKSGSTYNFNIQLSATLKDLGFFDTVDDTEIEGTLFYADAPPEYSFVGSYNFFNYDSTVNLSLFSGYTVTGFCGSRLSELEKYVVSTNPAVKYIPYTGGDGLSGYTITSGITAFTYIIGSIRYDDVLLAGQTAYTTTFIFYVASFPYNNFDVKRIVKLESKQNMVENPQVSRDVFIERQQQSVFERNYRLRAVNALNDVVSYAGGDYFTIYNNT